MPRERCLITHRVSGPCRDCGRQAIPAHVRGFVIYCEACCGCARFDAALGLGRPRPRGRTQGKRGHTAGAGCPARPGRPCIAACAIRPRSRNAPWTRYRRRYCAGTGREGQVPPRPFRAFLRPFLALGGAFYEQPRPRLAGVAPTRAAARRRQGEFCLRSARGACGGFLGPSGTGHGGQYLDCLPFRLPWVSSGCL
jgi:hypothetical protein